MSSGNIRFGHHLLRSWSKDQSVIALSSSEAELYAACMAAQRAMGIESMAREQGVDLGAMELQADAHAAIGIIGRQGLGKVRHLDLSFLWLQAAVRGKQVVLRKVQSGDNMADIGTKMLDQNVIQRHMENLGCVRFEQQSQETRGRAGVRTDTAISTSSLCKKNPLQVELERERPRPQL